MANTTVQVSKSDLAFILDALLELAQREGSTVAEALTHVAGPEGGMRIYNEVFSSENITVD